MTPAHKLKLLIPKPVGLVIDTSQDSQGTEGCYLPLKVRKMPLPDGAILWPLTPACFPGLWLFLNQCLTVLIIVTIE